MLTFDMYPKDNEVFVDVTYGDTEKKSKTISLDSFVSFVKSLESEAVISDTGLMTDNLIRKVETPTMIGYLFYYDKIVAPLRVSFDLDFSYYYEDEPVVEYTDVVCLVKFLKTNRMVEYSFHFAYPERDSLGMKKKLSNDTFMLSNFLPNSFHTSICWGALPISTESIRNAASSGDTVYLSSLIHHYVNTVFNKDLNLSRYTSFDYSPVLREAVTEVLGSNTSDKLMSVSRGSDKLLFLLLPLMKYDKIRDAMYQTLKESADQHSKPLHELLGV